MPRRRLHRRIRMAALWPALVLVAGTASAEAQTLERVRCPPEEASDPLAFVDLTRPKGTTCARVDVPLDHSGATAGRVSLDIARVPATGRRRATLAILTGGPGEPAVPAAGLLSALLRRVRTSHDLVFVDQRGSGGSGAVECPDPTSPVQVRACADRLGARRAFWTTRETALDLEDVRVALGADRLSLLGISYGAKVAGEYARRFPTRTGRIILDSPAPVDGLDTSLSLRQLGLARVLREVCVLACKRFVADPNLALRTLVRRLERRPLRGRAVLESGRTRAAQVTASDVYGLVVLSDLDPSLRRSLPAAIASGVLGDPAPLLRLLASASRAGAEVAEGVNVARLLATSCVEGRLPWAPDAPLAGRRRALLDAFNAAPDATFAPFSRETVERSSIAAVCTNWPSTPRPEAVPQRGPDLPVLVLSGRQDLRTPLEDARRTASQYPDATVLAVPAAGHFVLGSDPTSCALDRLTAFLGGRPVVRCARERLPTGIVPFVPASVRDLRHVRGVPGDAGRLAAAVTATLRDADRTVIERLTRAPGADENDSVRVPGLRGGTATFGPRGALRLDEYELVRGVRVSGRVQGGSGSMTVTAPDGTRATLTQRRGRFSGTIGGAPVRLVVS